MAFSIIDNVTGAFFAMSKRTLAELCCKDSIL
jgi:hypothetical protein